MMMAHVAWFVALAAIALAQAPAPATNPALVRVFVHTDERGDARDVAARKESVRDLSVSVAGKKKALAVVDVPKGADVVLEILERTVIVPKVVMGLSPRASDPTNMPGMNGPVRQVILRVKATAGGDPVIFTNKNKPVESVQGWKSAADDIRGQVEKWIAAQRDFILKRRQAGVDQARSQLTR